MKTPLNHLFEEMFGIEKINNKKDLMKIVKELRKSPDKIIDLQKYSGQVAK
jgi:hypothetical protein